MPSKVLSLPLLLSSSMHLSVKGLTVYYSSKVAQRHNRFTSESRHLIQTTALTTAEGIDHLSPRWNAIRIRYMAIPFLTLRHLQHRININNGALIMMRTPLYIFYIPERDLALYGVNQHLVLNAWSLLPAFTVPVS